MALTTILDLINQCEILPGYKTDHSLLKIETFIDKFEHGKGLWKFNSSLLKEQEYLTLINVSLLKKQEYLTLINDAIQDEMLRYVVPVYTLEFQKNNGPNNIHLSIDDKLFLETLLIRLRGKTIKFASLLKKTKNE